MMPLSLDAERALRQALRAIDDSLGVLDTRIVTTRALLQSAQELLELARKEVESGSSS